LTVWYHFKRVLSIECLGERKIGNGDFGATMEGLKLGLETCGIDTTSRESCDFLYADKLYNIQIV
jgi:hypothetical protein